MAAQGVKLMERLKNTHGDKDTLRHQLGAVVGSKFGAGHCLVVPLDSVESKCICTYTIGDITHEKTLNYG